ncbi:response regulator [Clostridium fermenticellae]|uniref:response regulator n=1 Tax=Clostridium fermenticellae TaxID=2068654 RepID=UPI0026A9254B
MRKFKILLVEDEKQMSMFIEMELIHEGYEVDTAYDGRKALEKVEKRDYNLILLDIMIPGLNGYESTIWCYGCC